MKARICALAALSAGLVCATAARSTPQRAIGPQRTGTIAFIRFENTNNPGGPLFLIRPDGSGLHALTPRRTTVREYAWSPDGRSIAYVDQRWSLWLVHPDGTGRSLLLPGSRLSTTSLSWSPDGKTIAIASPGPDTRQFDYCKAPATLYLVPTSGARPKALPVRGIAGCYIAWSPQGDEIAYWGRSGTSVIHPDGTGRRRVPHASGGAQWSADGRKLLFEIPNSYRSEFAVAAVNGTHFHVVMTHAYDGVLPGWSPEGHRIMYGIHNWIYVIDANGRDNRRVISGSPRKVNSVAWSPDGSSIVYEDDRTGHGDIYVVGMDGRGQVQLTNTPANDIDPSWAP